MGSQWGAGQRGSVRGPRIESISPRKETEGERLGESEERGMMLAGERRGPEAVACDMEWWVGVQYMWVCAWVPRGFGAAVGDFCII